MFNVYKLYNTYKEVKAAIDHLFDVDKISSIEWNKDDGQVNLWVDVGAGKRVKLELNKCWTSVSQYGLREWTLTNSSVDKIEKAMLEYFPNSNLSFRLDSTKK